MAAKRPAANQAANAGRGGGVRNPSPSARAYRDNSQQRQAKLDDLRMTLGHADGQAMADNNLVTFHEKVDNIMEEQE